MGFPTHKLATRAGLVVLMLSGGLLYAGISQAQDVSAPGPSPERSAELAAASGGPAPDAHLIAFTSDRAAVETREDDVAPLTDIARSSARLQAAAAGDDGDATRRVAAAAPAPDAVQGR